MSSSTPSITEIVLASNFFGGSSAPELLTLSKNHWMRSASAGRSQRWPAATADSQYAADRFAATLFMERMQNCSLTGIRKTEKAILRIDHARYHIGAPSAQQLPIDRSALQYLVPVRVIGKDERWHWWGNAALEAVLNDVYARSLQMPGRLTARTPRPPPSASQWIKDRAAMLANVIQNQREWNVEGHSASRVQGAYYARQAMRPHGHHRPGPMRGGKSARSSLVTTRQTPCRGKKLADRPLTAQRTLIGGDGADELVGANGFDIRLGDRRASTVAAESTPKSSTATAMGRDQAGRANPLPAHSVCLKNLTGTGEGSALLQPSSANQAAPNLGEDLALQQHERGDWISGDGAATTGLARSSQATYSLRCRQRHHLNGGAGQRPDPGRCAILPPVAGHRPGYAEGVTSYPRPGHGPGKSQEGAEPVRLRNGPRDRDQRRHPHLELDRRRDQFSLEPGPGGIADGRPARAPGGAGDIIYGGGGRQRLARCQHERRRPGPALRRRRQRILIGGTRPRRTVGGRGDDGAVSPAATAASWKAGATTNLNQRRGQRRNVRQRRPTTLLHQRRQRQPIMDLGGDDSYHISFDNLVKGGNQPPLTGRRRRRRLYLERHTTHPQPPQRPHVENSWRMPTTWASSAKKGSDLVLARARPGHHRAGRHQKTFSGATTSWA
ncbi:hypothetical protein FQR65_LT20838 [Abscondita terminalis]|nr:hypothetical protein FQR65_LT20838 [Abscondita terminalis]